MEGNDLGVLPTVPSRVDYEQGANRISNLQNRSLRSRGNGYLKVGILSRILLWREASGLGDVCYG